MPVDTPTPEGNFTILHFLANADLPEAETLPIVIWLVEEKGADATVLDEAGLPAAQVAYDTGKMRMCAYLKEQEKRQAARKAEEDERQAAREVEEKKKQDEEKAALFKVIAAKAAREKKQQEEEEK